MKFVAVRDITNNDLFGDMVTPEEIGLIRIPAGTIGEETYNGGHDRSILFEGQTIDWSFTYEADYVKELSE